MTKIFRYIVAKYFFPEYAKDVHNWKNKMRGKSGRGQPLDFTDADKKLIKKGIRQLFKDLLQ